MNLKEIEEAVKRDLPGWRLTQTSRQQILKQEEQNHQNILAEVREKNDKIRKLKAHHGCMEILRTHAADFLTALHRDLPGHTILAFEIDAVYRQYLRKKFLKAYSPEITELDNKIQTVRVYWLEDTEYTRGKIADYRDKTLVIMQG